VVLGSPKTSKNRVGIILRKVDQINHKHSFMKKAKIMLTAVAAIAIVSGALAFKAQKSFTSNIYCSTTATTDCPDLKLQFTLTENSNPGSIVATFCTDTQHADCSNAVTIYPLN